MLRDAHMDERTASHGTACAIAVLRARHLARRRDASELLSSSGIQKLRGGRSVPAELGRERPEPVHEINSDEEGRRGEWRKAPVAQTEGSPDLVAFAYGAWCRIAPRRCGRHLLTIPG